MSWFLLNFTQVITYIHFLTYKSLWPEKAAPKTSGTQSADFRDFPLKSNLILKLKAFGQKIYSKSYDTEIREIRGFYSNEF